MHLVFTSAMGTTPHQEKKIQIEEKKVIFLLDSTSSTRLDSSTAKLCSYKSINICDGRRVEKRGDKGSFPESLYQRQDFAAALHGQAFEYSRYNYPQHCNATQHNNAEHSSINLQGRGSQLLFFRV